MQRLFSSFADRWPGVGLLLQRLITAGFVLYFAAIEVTGTSSTLLIFPSIVAACAAPLLLIGLWTPVVGVLIAAMELWLAIASIGQPWIPILLGTLSVTLSMIGPGAWSVDARLFGRKHIET